MTKSKVAGIKDRMLNEYNKKYAAKKVTQMTETTKNVLNGVLTDSQAKGLGIKDTLKNILDKVEDMRLSRAKTIARTETSSAINNTSLRTAKEAKMKKKTWVWIGGRYTFRENHRRLNGLTIGIDEYFDLGKGIKTLSPHHPSLPASEVCNCSCLILFK
ncbi:MAG: phage minor head protein [Cetobacterium sp.]